MTEVIETPKRVEVSRYENADCSEKREFKHDDFKHFSPDVLAALWKTTKILKENKSKMTDREQMLRSEKVYKEVSLELFFRIYGDQYRDGYNKWLKIKEKKQLEWKQQMQKKYGDNWIQQVTLADQELLSYSPNELEAYAKHKAIEEEALQLKKKDVKRLLKNERNEHARKINYFELVKWKTLELYPDFNEKEVRKAVYSIDFLLFYMNQMLVVVPIKEIVGQQEDPQISFEQLVLKGVAKATGIVEKNRTMSKKEVLPFLI